MKIRVNKKRWYLTILNVILVALALICVLIFSNISGTLNTIQTAERWKGSSDMRFAQIGCFLPVDAPKTEEDIFIFRRTLDQKLIDASLEAPEGGSLYTDAYSGTSKLTVTGDHGQAEVEAIGIGGSFFLFHPLQLRSGSYIFETDFMQDRVILDEGLAWQLFGGADVAGMTVIIQQQTFQVAGVIQRESDFASQKALHELPMMFMSYSAFEALTEEGITSYEIVMPDMISGFAQSIVSENFDLGSGDLVENSSRYSLQNLFHVIGDFGHRSMRNNGVIYPYWENAVRLTEDYLALLVILIILLGLLPAVCILVWSVRSVIRCYRTAARKIPERAEAMRERRREEKYAKSGEK